MIYLIKCTFAPADRVKIQSLIRKIMTSRKIKSFDFRRSFICCMLSCSKTTFAPQERFRHLCPFLSRSKYPSSRRKVLARHLFLHFIRNKCFVSATQLEVRFSYLRTLFIRGYSHIIKTDKENKHTTDSLVTNHYERRFS